MERLTLTHLNGPNEGAIVTLRHLPVVIGSEPGLDVVVAGADAQHCRIERNPNGELVLRDGVSEAGTFLAGQRVREAVLRNGDVIELGASGPRMRVGRQQSHRDTLVDAVWGRRGRPSKVGLTLRRNAILLWRNIGLRWALIVAMIAVPSGALLFEILQLRRLHSEDSREGREERQRLYQTIDAERQKYEAQHTSLEQQIEEFRTREAELTLRLGVATADEGVRTELQKTRERIQSLESERAVGEHIIREFGAGVCLIQGSYAYYDASLRPLRHRLDDRGHKMHEDDGSPALSVEGQGAIYTVDYYGTGFLVDRGGLVLSNRHVAVPWWDDDKADELKKDGFEPRFVLFRAFFPKESEPFELDPLRHSDAVDLAVMKIELRGRKIPILPLDQTGKGAVPGQPVVVVGYPTGLEAILAKADNDVVQTILKKYGRQSEHVTEALSEKGLIRPSTTQGHIGDVTSTDIVFDAPTTQGGSGGPVFNKAGEVVAIEYAVLPKFGGTAFGIPIHYAVDLVRAARKPARRGQG